MGTLRHKTERAPRCMGTLRHKTERAPRCMGTLFVFSWSGWVPPRAPQAIAPNIHFQIVFLLVLFFGIHLVAARGVVTPGGGGTDARTDGRTDAGSAPDPPPQRTQEKNTTFGTTPSLRPGITADAPAAVSLPSPSKQPSPTSSASILRKPLLVKSKRM